MRIKSLADNILMSSEAGGSALSRVFQKINTDVLEGGKGLTNFANVAGVSANEFASTWQNDPQKAIESFVQGLDKVQKSGGDVTGVLKELGISSSTEVDTLIRLSGATELLSNSLERGTKAWKDNTALNEEAETAAKSTASQIQLAKNQLVLLGDSIGQILMPMILSLIKVAVNVVSALNDMGEGTKRAVVVLGIMAAIIPPIILLMGGMITSIGSISAAWTTYIASGTIATTVSNAWRVGVTRASVATVGLSGATAMLAGAMAFLLSPIGLVLIAITSLVAAVVWMYKKFHSASKGVTDDSNKMLDGLKKTKDGIENVLSGVKAEAPKGEFEKYGEGINEGISDGLDGSAHLPVNSMKDMNEDLKKELTKTRDELQQKMQDNIADLDKFGDAIQTALKNKYQGMLDNQLEFISKRVDNERKASQSIIKSIQDLADKEKKILDRRKEDLRKSTDDRIKEFKREHDARVKLVESDSNFKTNGLRSKIDAINKQTDAEKKAIEQRGYNERLALLQSGKAHENAIDKKVNYEKKASQQSIDLIKDKADRERDALNKSLDTLKRATDDRIAEYRRDYDAEMSLLDRDTNSKTGALNAKIAEIDKATEMEQRSFDKRTHKQKLSNLERQRDNAKTANEKARIQREIDVEIRDWKRKMLLQQRSDEKESLREQIEAVRENAQQQKEELDNNLNNKVSAVEAELEAEQEAIRSEIDTLTEVAERKIEIERSRIEAVLEGLAIEKQAMQDKVQMETMISERKQKLAEEERQKEIERIEQEIEKEEKLKEEKVKKLEDEHNQKVESEKNKMEVTIAALEEEMDLLKKQTDEKVELEGHRIDAIVEALDNEKKATSDHYGELMKQENLFAEARKMVIAGNNNEIMSLLQTYNPKWQDAGQGFADSMINGLNSQNEAMDSAIARSLNLGPVIQDQIKELDLLEAKIEGIKEKDSDLFPETKVGLGETKEGLESVKESLSEADKKVEESESIWTKMGKGLTSVWQEVKKEFSETAKHNENVLNGMAEVAYNKTRQMEKSFGDWVVNTKRSVVEGLGSLVESMNTIGSNIATGLHNGLVKGATAIFDTVRTIADGITGVFSRVLDIRSPSRVFTKLGEYTGEGLQIGMEHTIPDIVKSAEMMADATQVDYGVVSSPRVEAKPINASMSDSTIENILKIVDSSKGMGGEGGSQDIVLQIGQVELARAVVNSIRQLEKQTGQIIIG